ncbi:hypothetical protein KQI84_08150 [bacterium]|nr:hypothetical protein [bacterium]
MTAKPIAFLTMDSLEGFFTYDKLASDILVERGWRVDDVSWRAEVDWGQYGYVVIRSPWDYQNAPAEFLEALRRIDASSAQLMNSLEIVEWNLNKAYLLGLREAGVPIVPTIHGRNATMEDLPRLAAELGTEELILKPLFGANADGVFRIPAPFDGAIARAAAKHYAGAEYLAQPFLDSILGEGELSLFYFLSEYSHAIVKRPKSGDFRVQEEHGGVMEPITPTDEMHAASEAALAAIPGETLYARIDLARCPDGGLGVMEVEVIEPSLYFNMDPDSAARFVDAFERIAGR